MARVTADVVARCKTASGSRYRRSRTASYDRSTCFWKCKPRGSLMASRRKATAVPFRGTRQTGLQLDHRRMICAAKGGRVCAWGACANTVYRREGRAAIQAGREPGQNRRGVQHECTGDWTTEWTGQQEGGTAALAQPQIQTDVAMRDGD